MTYVLAFELLSRRSPLGDVTKLGQPECANSEVDGCCSHRKMLCSHTKVDVWCCCGGLHKA